jgi:hypothetical protein
MAKVTGSKRRRAWAEVQALLITAQWGENDLGLGRAQPDRTIRQRFRVQHRQMTMVTICFEQEQVIFQGQVWSLSRFDWQ